MTYGTRLNQALTHANKTRKQLAEFLGCKPQAIGMVITGGGKVERKLSTENHAKAVDFLKVSDRWLLSDDGPMVPSAHSFQASASVPESQQYVAVTHDQQAQAATNNVAEALQFLARSISISSSKGSDALAGTLVSLSKDPTNPIYQELLAKMLQPPERPGVESKDFQPSVSSIFTKTIA